VKDYWQLREVLSEAKRGNWVRPNDASIRKEYQIEYLKHLIHELPRNIFPTEAKFVKAVKSAPTVQIDSATDRKIHNRSRTRDMEQLLDLISGYRSFPKFRNEDTLKELEKLIKSGKPVDMPIVVKFPKGGMRVLAGNTRMDIAFMNGINPTVVMLDLTPYMKLTEAANPKKEPIICELLSKPTEEAFVNMAHRPVSSGMGLLKKYSSALIYYFDSTIRKPSVHNAIIEMCKCKNRANWTYSFDNQLVWRGFSKTARYLAETFKFTGELVEFNGVEYLVATGTYKSEHPIQSWSYEFRVAQQFTNYTIPSFVEDTIQTIIEYRIKRQETFLTPDVIRQISAHTEEKEVLRVSNTPIQVRAYVSLWSAWGNLVDFSTGNPDERDIKTFKTRLAKITGEDALKRIITSNLWKHFEKKVSKYSV
jgi:hypothetical protein